MSNSPLVTYTRITKNRTSPRRHAIDTITIHCIVGQWTAKQGCDYFATTDRECSSNYVVGKDGSIGLCVEEKDRAWTSGGDKKVNGISGSENDQRAITIEVASDTKPPYKVTDAALNALIDLCEDICRRNNIKQLLWKADSSLVGKIDKQNMTVHRWFANKSCPGDYLYNLHGHIADEVNKRLSGGKESEPKKEILYRVQVGAYSKEANADRQLQKIKAKGFDTYKVKVGNLYKIQIGAYSVKTNADAMLKKVKAAGFDAFITT
ncbi:MAG: N-acetylmuramoyl-L-alanine amidase [Roseburia sp.]|nr:N-acetylmuramoyl-L-alanine amidase [Roseburia sp.]